MIQTKILLVDDEDTFVSALTKRLSKRHLNVSCASSGAEALKTLDQEPDVDVVILDVKMPEMDGIETLRHIKETFPSVEVIMLTGHATFESAIQGMKLGAFDYLMKPCDLEELLSKVEEAKAKRRRHLEKILEATGRDLHRKKSFESGGKPGQEA
ncbi:MAG TPA: response regulator [Desulfomonilaceae bacterium]|nr:response regulator [Desulfomonilaceae bacterium]